ncbi:MAG: heme A synthase [Gemmatimonadota bacterium]
MSDPTGRLRRWTRLSALAALSTYALIVLGGIVRITGSGLGCGDDWPLCNGHLIPPMDLPTLIEYGHRLAALAVTVLVLATALAAWRTKEPEETWVPLRRLGLAAVLLLALQILLGAVTVWWELPPASVVLHLGTGMLLLSVLVVGTLRAATGREARIRDRTSGWLGWVAAFGFIVVLAGALVANLDAAPACQGFPLCNGEWMPGGGNELIHVHWTHRVVAYALVLVCLGLPWTARRHRPGDGPVRAAALWAAALALAQLVGAAVMILGGLRMGWRALHMGLGAAVFVALVALAWLGSRERAA